MTDEDKATGSKQLRQYILADDISLIKDALGRFESYRFSKDIKSRMAALGLSANGLAKRCLVSHTMVGKWCSGRARPHGKERVKELGMALGMDESGLNAFLYENGYPRLYAKNPLDNACKLLLKTLCGKENIVEMYRQFLVLYGLNDFVPSPDRLEVETSVMSRNFDAVVDSGDFKVWFSQHKDYFNASAKQQTPNAKLVRFILLYIGTATINEMYKAGELPVPLKNMLYLLTADKALAVRGLRDKLIAFGLYSNMTEEEINVMLTYAKLSPISEPNTRLDFAVLTALRCAHERYPYYEYNGLIRLIARMKAVLAETSESEEQARLTALCQSFEVQRENAEARVRYYDESGQKSETDRLFEQAYTSYADKGIIDYTHDILLTLVDTGCLKKEETGDFLHLIVH